MKRKDRILRIVMAGAVGLALCTQINAAQEIAKLLASDRQADDDFGLSVAISGQCAVIGAPGEDTLGDDAGAAYVFRFNGTAWVEEAKLLASDGAFGDSFGTSVAISEDYIVVGAVGGRTVSTQNTGAAYVFYYNGTSWSQQAKLNASDAANGGNFGCSIAMNSDLAVIGSWGDDARGLDAGAAYIFARAGTTWTQQQKLLASDGTADDSFGVAVALDGDYLIVGASGDDDYGNDSGAAYVFHYGGSSWAQQQKLTTVDGIANHFFGESVAINANHAVIGASGDGDIGYSSGAAYYFVRSGTTWTATTKLMPADLGPGDSFGNAVALCSSYALIAARGEQAVYVFTWDGADWVEQSKLADPAGGASDVFGYSVATGLDYAIVGAFGDDDDRGSAYVYDGTSLQVAPVYRFWSPTFANHFYTISQAEKDYVIGTWSDIWMYEAISYYAFPEATVEGLMPVYRFWSGEYNSHFYTISAEERDYVIATFASNIWSYEGAVFYAFPEGEEPEGTIPVYRFWSDDLRAHFYTATEDEKEYLIAHPERGWAYEGVAWYAYEQ